MVLVICLGMIKVCSSNSLMQEQPFPIYFHCFAHCLNLVLEKCAETFPVVHDVFSTIGSIYKVMEGSSKRHAVYEVNLKRFSIKDGSTALRGFSDTRWAARPWCQTEYFASPDCHIERA